MTRIDQCEGCYSPLGDWLDAGHEMAEFDVTYYLCASHEPINNLPFDVYDDYDG